MLRSFYFFGYSCIPDSTDGNCSCNRSFRWWSKSPASHGSYTRSQRHSAKSTTQVISHEWWLCVDYMTQDWISGILDNMERIGSTADLFRILRKRMKNVCPQHQLLSLILLLTHVLLIDPIRVLWFLFMTCPQKRCSSPGRRKKENDTNTSVTHDFGFFHPSLHVSVTVLSQESSLVKDSTCLNECCGESVVEMFTCDLQR